MSVCSTYVYGVSDGSNPRSGSFTTNAQTFVNTTMLRMSVCDAQGVSNYYNLDGLQGGGTIILTSRLNDSIKFIFKVVTVLPPYIINSVVQYYNYNVSFLWGSQYNPTENHDEFYIEFASVDRMRPYCPPYMSPPTWQQTALVACPPTAVSCSCGGSQHSCSCQHVQPHPHQHTCPTPQPQPHPHPQPQPHPHPHPPSPPCVPVLDVTDTSRSTGSFLYRYDSNYGGSTNPALTDAAGGTFRINGSGIDSSTFLQFSTTDSSDTPYNNASFLNSLSAGSTVTLYNVSSGKRCIFSARTSATQSSSVVSTAAQTNPTLYGSYVFKVNPLSTDYGITLNSGDMYVVTFTLASTTGGAAIQQLVQDLLPNSGNTVSLGSLVNTFKDIYIGPNSLYISTYKFGCDASGNIVLTNTAGSNIFTFDFQALSTQAQTTSVAVQNIIASGGGGGALPFNANTILVLSTIASGANGSNLVNTVGNTSSSANLSTLVGALTPSTASNLSALAATLTGTAGSSLGTLVTALTPTNAGNLATFTTSLTGTAGASLATVVGSLTPTTAANLATLTGSLTGTAGASLATVVGSLTPTTAANLATLTGSLTGTAGASLATVVGSLTPTTAANLSTLTGSLTGTAGASLAALATTLTPSTASNVSLVTTSLGGVTAANTSTLTSLISSTGAVGQVLTKTATSVGWTTVTGGGGGGGSIATDNTTLVSSISGVYSVSNNISTAGSYLGPIAASVANTTSLINAAATAGQVLTKTATSYAWSNATGGGGGGSILTDNTTLVSSISGVYSVATNITNAASAVNAAGTVGYVLTKTATSATWQAASGGGGGGGGLSNITIKLAYSNASGGTTPWNDSAAGNILINSNLTNSLNTLPSGWTILYDGPNLANTGYTKVGLFNASFTPSQITPVSVRAIYAKSSGAGTITNFIGRSWLSYALDNSYQSAEAAAITINTVSGSTTGLYTVAPQTTLDGSTFNPGVGAAAGVTPAPTNSALAAADGQLLATQTAMYVKLSFMFDTNA